MSRKKEHGQSEPLWSTIIELGWKLLSERRTQFVASLMYKITHGRPTKTLADIFQRKSSSQYYNLRGSSTQLYLPNPKTEYLKKALVTIEEQNCGTSQMN
jgi:hypothetical protein